MKFLCDITMLQLTKYVFLLKIKYPFKINGYPLPKLFKNFVSSAGKKYLDSLDSCQNRDLSTLASLWETVGGE